MGSKEHTAAIELHPGHKPSEEKEEQKRHPAASVSVGDNWHEGQKSPWHGRTPRGARGVRSGHAKSWGEGVPDGFGAVVKERGKVLLIRFRGLWVFGAGEIYKEGEIWSRVCQKGQPHACIWTLGSGWPPLLELFTLPTSQVVHPQNLGHRGPLPSGEALGTSSCSPTLLGSAVQSFPIPWFSLEIPEEAQASASWLYNPTGGTQHAWVGVCVTGEGSSETEERTGTKARRVGSSKTGQAQLQRG